MLTVEAQDDIQTEKISPDGERMIYTTDWNSNFFVHNVLTKEKVFTLDHKHKQEWTGMAAFTPDGKWIVTATSTVS